MKKSPSVRRGIFLRFFDGNVKLYCGLDGGFNPPKYGTIRVDQR